MPTVITISETGPQGATGPAASLQVGTVTASSPGSAPTVTNSGSNIAAVFDFVLPRGETGPQGPVSPLATATSAGIVPGIGGTITGNAARVVASSPGSGSIPQTWLEFPTSHRSDAPYVIGANSNDYGANDKNQTDATFVIGFNTTPQTNKIVPGTGATSGRKQYLLFEHDYWAGAGDINTRLDEFHYDVEHDNGVVYRIFQITNTPSTPLAYQTAWSGAMSFADTGLLGQGTTTQISRGGLLLDANADISAYNQARTSVSQLLGLDSANRTNLSGFGTGVVLNGAPLRLDGNLDNTLTRPATSASPIPGEIWGHSRQTPGNADGFLRLSAGGGASGGAAKSRIDISGFSTVSDMNQNIVLYPGATEALRVAVGAVSVTGALSTTGHFTVAGSFLASSSTIFTPSAINQNINFGIYPSGTALEAQLILWGKSTSSNADYAAINYVGINRLDITTGALGSAVARRINLGAGGYQMEFLPPGEGGTVTFLSGALVAVANVTASSSTTTGALKVAGGLGVAGRTSTAALNVGATNGTTIDLIASASATLDFPGVPANGGTQDLTITVTGATVGDVVTLGLPAAPNAGLVFSAWVSASNTVTVRATNVTAGAIDPVSAAYRIAVMSF